MFSNQNVKLSKFLCLILCHKPESIDLQLNEYGWADVTQLINNLNEAGKNINFGILKEIVETATNTKI